MRQFFLLVSFSLAISFSAQAQKEEKCPDWQKDSLRGRVKSYVEELVTIVKRDGVIIKESRQTTESTSYNDKGYLLELTYSPSNGSANSKLTYRYDDKNRLIEKNSFEAKYANPERTVYVYDDTRNSVEETDYYRNGGIKYRTISLFDAKGNMIEQNSCDEGKDCRIFKQSFDELGRVIETKSYNPDGSLYVQMSFTYDNNGRKTGKYIYTAPDYAYAYYYGRTITFRTCDKGNVLEICDWDKDSDAAKGFVCERDQQGNWIKQTYEPRKNKNGTTEITIVYRNIVYY